jgi:NADPH:quinone reductase-like Zn-dependent oxidoreductase
MKAIVYLQYGTPDQLQLKEVEKPIPKDGEVLVKVIASSINSWDADMLKGNAFIIRLIGGFFKPRHKILGADIAGIVESVGPNVKDFKPGDEVLGDIAESGFGGYAEYVSVEEKLLAKKSSKMTFDQAAALPQVGLLALQGLRQHGEVQKGQQILINGAGGGVGPIALQYAKYRGAEETCVDIEDKFDMLRSLGADHLIDFRKEDYTKTGKQYDKILDVIAHRTVSDYKRALKQGGVFSMIGGSMGWLLVQMMLLPLLPSNRNKKVGIMGYKPNRKDLDYLVQLCEEGKVVPIVDRSFDLTKTPDAFRYFISGKFKGKIVISVR